MKYLLLLLLISSSYADLLYKSCTSDHKPTCLKVTSDKKRYDVFFDGPINSSSYSLAKEALGKIPDNESFTLYLNSGGGETSLAEKIGRLATSKCEKKQYLYFGKPYCKKCEVTTKVDEGNRCASACVGVYTAGHVKDYETEAKFGFHRSSDLFYPEAGTFTIRRGGGDEQIIITEESLRRKGREEMIKSLIKWNVNQAFIDKLDSLGALERKEMTYLRPHELQDSGILDNSLLPYCE